MLYELNYLNVNSAYESPMEATEFTPWVRVVSPYQGHHRGSLIIPERYEQVLVGFEKDNVERPYVIGGLYHDKEMPSEWSQYDKNRVKGFRSRSGHCIEFVDGKDTDSGTSTGGRIHIYDAKTHAYDIYFNTDKKLISFVSKGDIELKADNNISINAGNDINVTVGNNYTTDVKNDMTTNVGNDVKTDTKGGEEHHSVGEIWTYSDKYLYMQGGEEVYLEAAETNLFYANDVNVGVYGKCTDADFTTCKSQFQINSSHIVMDTKDLELWINNQAKNVKIDSNKDIEVKAFGNIKSDSLGQTQINGHPAKIN